jgi:hypothetical protein
MFNNVIIRSHIEKFPFSVCLFTKTAHFLSPRGLIVAAKVAQKGAVAKLNYACIAVRIMVGMLAATIQNTTIHCLYIVLRKENGILTAR